MGIILDAGVLIAEERGTFDLPRWLDTHGEDRFALAAITVSELLHGLERASGTHRARREAYIGKVLAGCEVLPFTAETAAVHARIWAQVESAGQMIGFHDLIVAATALEHRSPVATFNLRHFAIVPGLTVIEPA